MKFSTIFIIALVASSVLAAAGDENCKDHPWAKRDLVDKILNKRVLEGWEDTDGHVALLIKTFSSTSTLTDLTTMTATTHPMVPADWITTDVTSCCTAEVVKALKAVPAAIVSMLQNRPSKFERALGAFSRVIKKCGRKPGKKGTGSGSGSATSVETTAETTGDSSDSDSAAQGADVDFEKMTLRKLLKMLKAKGERIAADGSAAAPDSAIDPTSATQEELDAREFGGAIELMKLFFQGKAAVFQKWIDLQRGNLMFLCRRPSMALNSLKDKKADGVPKMSKDDDAKNQEGMKAGFGRIIVAVNKLSQAIGGAFKSFGGPKCEKPAEMFVKKMKGSIGKQCGEKGKCKDQKFGFRLFDFGVLRALTSKPKSGAEDEGSGKLGGKMGDKALEHNKPEKPETRLRMLADEGDEAVVAEANDKDAVPNVSDPDVVVSFGGVDESGNCKSDDADECDYEADKE